MPSPDGKLLAYSLSDGGTDWRTWHFRDVATGTDLPDVLRFIKFSRVLDRGLADFYYAAIRCAPTAPAIDSKQRESTVHRLGDDAVEDERAFEASGSPDAESVRAASPTTAATW